MAVLIDATIVRGVLLPASMKVLGDWNWYLPSWLEWLPRMGSETPDLPPADTPEAAEPSRAAEARPGARLMALIEVEHLSKRFGEVHAVEDLTFSIEAGTIAGFLGPNGSGKTTTLRSLLGLVTPTSGKATIAGRRYGELADPLREVGVMLEASAHPARTARNHLRIAAAEARVPRARVDELLELVDLDEAADRRISHFSLGMHQRLGLATALIGDPEMLVLDEPANGLDPEGIRWLRGFLQASPPRAARSCSPATCSPRSRRRSTRWS